MLYFSQVKKEEGDNAMEPEGMEINVESEREDESDEN